jgi:DNA mismatch repair protein MSH3
MYSPLLLSVSTSGQRIRTERFKGLMSYTDAFSYVSEFYTDKTKSVAASESFNSGLLINIYCLCVLQLMFGDNTGKLMAAVADFPKRVVVALAHAIKHLSAFSIADAFLETKFFSKFTTRAHMLLNGNTLTNL